MPLVVLRRRQGCLVLTCGGEETHEIHVIWHKHEYHVPTTYRKMSSRFAPGVSKAVEVL